MFVAALSDFVKIVANQQWREAIWTKVVQLVPGEDSSRSASSPAP